jgi:DNA-binding NarL/FixJ family response regulator
MERNNNINLPRDIKMNITDLKHDVLLSIRIKRDQLPEVVKSLAELTTGINGTKTDQIELSETSNKFQTPSKAPRNVLWINDKLYLTPQEIKVMELLELGKENKEIAAALNLKESTIKNYVQRIFKKFVVNNRTEAGNRYRPLKIRNLS